MTPYWLFWATTLYEIVTVSLYWRLIYVLCKNKEFSAPFFQFLWIIGICENIHYVIDVLYYRLPMFEPTAGWFDKAPSRWQSIGPFLIYFFNYPVYFMQLAISVDRLTGLWRPIQHQIFWDRWWRPTVFCAFVLSICLCFHRSPLNATTQFVPFMPENPQLGYTPAIISYDIYALDTNLLTAIYNSLVVLLSMLINGATLFKIGRLRRSGNLAKISKAKLEMSLFIIVVWMMCSLIVVIAYQAANFIVRNGLIWPIDSKKAKTALYTIYVQQPWIDDLASVTHPWVVLAMCEPIRNATLPFLKPIIAGLKNPKNRQHRVISVSPADDSPSNQQQRGIQNALGPLPPSKPLNQITAINLSS